MRRMTLSGLSFDWFIGQLHPLRPGFWLLLSFVLSGLTLAAARFLPEKVVGRMRIGRWILTPYLGLLMGGLSPRLLGLNDIDWVAGLGLGVGLIFAIWLLLALVQATLHREETIPAVDRVTAARSGAARPAGRSFLEQIVWAGSQEFHWVFLRGAVWEMLLALPSPPALPGYWAIWLASLLALPGIFVQHRHTAQRVIAGMLLITTAILFFYTRNFFLCWLLHTSAGLFIGYGDTTVQSPTQSSMQKAQPR